MPYSSSHTCGATIIMIINITTLSITMKTATLFIRVLITALDTVMQSVANKPNMMSVIMLSVVAPIFTHAQALELV